MTNKKSVINVMLNNSLNTVEISTLSTVRPQTINTYIYLINEMPALNIFSWYYLLLSYSFLVWQHFCWISVYFEASADDRCALTILAWTEERASLTIKTHQTLRVSALTSIPVRRCSTYAIWGCGCLCQGHRGLWAA